MANSFLEQVRGKLIVSCQALPEEPLHSSFIMSRMAIAAVEGGAAGIRSNSVADIQAIREVVLVPVIGIIKEVYPDSPVFITPTIKEVIAACETGVEVVAMDGTNRKRPNGEDLATILQQAKSKFPDTLFMADIATVEEAAMAEQLGFDIVATTLHGYTEQTKGYNIAEANFQFLKEVLQATALPVIVEGKIDTPEKAKTALELGGTSVVVGGAITRPQEITARFISKLNS
ncbi:N-acetylmannosamine-6-phosphate 2-epimerase [Listeria booriae]|uniref:N-acetylmannosamine-6-phosphate 2-epimerase n=1 Tax=Listeria booriae TaxID=1552123 RepID=UPI00162AA1DF|nr:N-acetylmannosamine-6-phosphate 2-epimerase [Listeria booriae]MBC1511472.1 N-acetylmannosamine-6-phosphate 2-epimerase [Listeria booriae]MBC6151295.1 N-acetylmannosamine-6-phosphate 2-epimerase [Listeria booriae]MBC6305861.1 N-acetylmannosamine-6-phosphate 2-epimerase [Listeria booriae]